VLNLFRKLIFIFLFSLTVLASGQKQGRSRAQEVKVPDGVSYTVLNYRKEKVLRANQIGIAYKKLLKGQKLPVVVFIHGGGWSKGDKDQMAYMAVNYAKEGFVGVTISYRLLSEASYPDQVRDAKEAIRFIKSLENKFPIDIARIGVCGYSAGAHLSLLIALSQGESLYKSNLYREYDSKVKCAVGISTPIDLGKNKLKKIKFLSPEQNKDEELRRKSSPINYLHKEQIPILLFHGNKDKLVPSFHYENFLKKAQLMDINNIQTHISLEGGHMFFFKESRRLNPVMMKFFKDELIK
jgi:acetyl esterase/lipase